MFVSTEYIKNRIKEDPREFVLECEKEYDSKVQVLAEELTHDGVSCPLILLSGPSGSGKTTTSIKLSNCLRGMGYSVCCLPMDSYFENFTDEQRKLKLSGKINLESPERLDKDYINQDLLRLLNGEDVDLPQYDFSLNVRRLSGKIINRQNGFVIVEGIHALNSDVLGENDDFSKRVYISVKTYIKDNNGDILRTELIRLLRRMMRDHLFRGRTASRTIEMYPHVQQGEIDYIAPYKYRSDYELDSFISYEPCVFKTKLYNSLVPIQDKYEEVQDIIKALDEVEPIDIDAIPSNAFIREFIGGSSLPY